MTIIEVACDQAPQWKKAKNGVGSLRHEIFSTYLYFAILMFAVFATFKFRDFEKNLYFESF